MSNFYVYRHIRLDTNTPFYVGKGCGRRAFSKKSRNKYWHSIAKKGYRIEIVYKNIKEEESLIKEIKLIKLYKSFGLCQSNMTNGGEGSSGFNHSKESIEKFKIRNSGSNNPMFGKISAMKGRKHSEETRLKISKSNTGKKKNVNLSKERREEISKLHKGNTYCLGKKLSQDHKDKISKSSKGKRVGIKHPLFGSKTSIDVKNKISLSSPKNKKVINIETNEIYPNIRSASDSIGISRNTLKGYLSGRRKNKTKLSYLV